MEADRVRGALKMHTLEQPHALPLKALDSAREARHKGPTKPPAEGAEHRGPGGLTPIKRTRALVFSGLSRPEHNGTADAQSPSTTDNDTMTAVLRQSVRNDLPDLFRVRYAVSENRLSSRSIADDQVIEALEISGRGWVIELGGVIVAFAIGNARTGSIEGVQIFV